MKIVHIAPYAPYNEGWGYQDNLLPKYQAKLGHEVTLIITNKENRDGGLAEVPCCDYMSPDAFRVIRLRPFLNGRGKIGALLSRMDVYDLLKQLEPNLIFYHGINGITIFQISKYKRKIDPMVRVVQDNHLDYNIGFDPSDGLTQKLNCLFFRIVYKLNDRYIDKFYGVTPWRKQYGIEICGVPENKSDVLIMGADDEKIDFKHRHEIRKNIRNRYCISENEFLVVSGGKLSENKNIINLMRAVSGKNDIKLLLFGSVENDVKVEFDTLLRENSNIIYIGWIAADKVYDYFFAADLAVFPGQHSVLWEQACASKVPCVFKEWIGMNHVNNGGNAILLDAEQMKNLSVVIEKLKFTDEYYNMKTIAESETTDIYLYSEIAEKSVGVL